jgi:hypothetical protein
MPPEAAEAFRKAGIETPEKVAAVIAASLSISRSPFPSADMLREYDAFKPGMGAEVVDWIKGQTLHRQSLESQTTTGSETRLNRSQNNALIIALCGMVAAGAVSYWSPTTAVAIALLAIGGPSGASIVARLLDRVPKPD